LIDVQARSVPKSFKDLLSSESQGAAGREKSTLLTHYDATNCAFLLNAFCENCRQPMVQSVERPIKVDSGSADCMSGMQQRSILHQSDFGLIANSYYSWIAVL